MNQALSMIQHFAKLLALKNKPQDLRYSISAFNLLFITLCLTIFYLSSQLQLGALPKEIEYIAPTITFAAIAKEIIFLVIIFTLLKKDGKSNRFVQTATNFLGISIIEYLCSQTLAPLKLSFFALCGIKAWFLLIKLHITQHTFSVSKGKAAWIFINAGLSSIFIVGFAVAPFIARP